MYQSYAVLNREWTLRGWKDAPYVLVNISNGKHVVLSEVEYYVAKSCDGQVNFKSFIFSDKHISFLKWLLSKNIAYYVNDQTVCLENYQLYRQIDTNRIINVLWSITGKCNLNCKHCYEGKEFRNTSLDFESIRVVADQLKECNVQSISITGGEPFLRKDMKEIIFFLLKEKFTVTSIMTNALLINQDILEFFNSINFKTTFQISLDGLKGLHEEMRNQDNIEEKLLGKLRLIKQYGHNIVIATSILRCNDKRILDIYPVLKDIGVSSWRISTPQNMGNWKNENSKLPILSCMNLYNSIVDMWRSDKKPFKLKIGSFFNSEHHSRTSLDLLSFEEEYACEAMRLSPYILPDGTLLPCTGFTGSDLQKKMPNLLQTPLKKALNDPQFRKILDTKKGDLLKQNLNCIQCNNLPNCGLGCVANAYIETGTIYGKDLTNCEAWSFGSVEQLYEKANSFPIC